MSRILLLLDQKENQQVLARELDRDHEVRVAAADSAVDEDYDLLVTDGRALDRASERIRRRREREQPLYLPVLLVTSRPNVRMITRQLWRSIDELIITPIEKPELRARIQVLLRVRAQALELQERIEVAQRAVTMRDEVMQMVSHDLRNPLNVVLFNTSLLVDTASGLEPSQMDQLETMRRAVGQMSRLTEDLLDVEGLESGKIRIEPSRETVESLVQGACEQHLHAAEAAGVTLTCELDDGLPAVHADPSRMDQALGNLIGNALKFTPEGGSVVVRAAPRDDRVRISVRDTGPGLSEADAAQVFDRFWKGETAEAGAGLGLAIAKGIVDSHGGRVGVEGGTGEGAEFWLEIPAADGAPE